MSGGLGPGTCSAGLTEVRYRLAESGPSVVSSDEGQGFVDSEMAGEDVIVLVAQDAQSEVVGVGHEDSVAVSE